MIKTKIDEFGCKSMEVISAIRNELGQKDNYEIVEHQIMSNGFCVKSIIEVFRLENPIKP